MVCGAGKGYQVDMRWEESGPREARENVLVRDPFNRDIDAED
jgi:hypothetical protein